MRDRPKDVPLDLLHLLNLVVELGSMTKAGESVGVTQEDISQKMDDLQERYKTPLFEPGIRDGAKPSEAGVELNNYGQRVIEQSHRIERRLEELGSYAIPKLRIGYSRTHVELVAATAVAVRELPEFKEAVFIAEELEPRKAIERLKLHVIDLALVHVGPTDYKGISFQPAGNTPLEVIFQIGNEKLNSCSKVDPIRLRTIPLALFESGPVRDQVNKLLGKKRPPIVLQSNSRSMLLEFVSKDRTAATILAGHLAPRMKNALNVKALPFVENSVQETKFLWAEDREPKAVAKAFMQAAHELRSRSESET